MAQPQLSPQPAPESLRGKIPIDPSRQTAAQLREERDYWRREADTMVAEGRLASAELAIGFGRACAKELANRKETP
ncbi:MAG: hypothetical protein WB816_11990 [Methylocystis sp.]